MNLILHPGYGKCGSSTIQKGLSIYSEHLEELGIYCMDSEIIDLTSVDVAEATNNPGLLGYFQFMNDHELHEDFEEALEKIIIKKWNQGFHTILISAENLCSRHFLKEESIHGVFSRVFDKKKVVFYIRRQDDWIVSAWKQWRHKRGHSLEKSAGIFMNGKGLRFKVMGDWLVKWYGINSVEIRPLHKPSLIDQDLFVDFCYRAGIQLPQKYEAFSSANESGNLYLYEILHRIPHIYEGQYHSPRVERIIQGLVSDESPVLTNRREDIMTGDLRNRILDSFEDENKQLHSCFFPELNYDEIYLRPPIEENQAVRLTHEIDNLKDIIALQMEMILRIGDEKEKEKEKGFRKTVKSILSRLNLI